VERGDEANRHARAGQPTTERMPFRRSLRECYLDVTDFVLAEVHPKYDAAGVPCTDAMLAAVAATLFIGLCKERGL
jgi:hypothetical protein